MGRSGRVPFLRFRGAAFLVLALLSCGRSVVEESIDAGTIDAGTTCEVEENGDGTKTVTCSDGTSAIVPNDQYPPTQPGGTCRVANPGSPDGGISITCVGGSSCVTLEGDYYVRDNQDWVTFVRAGCTTVTGALTIGDGVKMLAPPAEALHSVGSLVVRRNLFLTTLFFPSLEVVSGELTIFYNRVATLELPRLTTVDGSLTVEEANELTRVNMPELMVVGGDLRLIALGTYSNTLGTLALPRLRSVTGDLHLANTPLPLNLPALTTLGSLIVDNNRLLPNLALPLLDSVGTLHVLNNPELTSLSLPALTTVLGRVMIGNPKLTDLSLPGLTTVAGDLDLFAGQLRTLTLPALRQTADLRVSSAWLEELNLPSLTAVAQLTLRNNLRMTSVNLPLLTTVLNGSFRTGPVLALSENLALTSVQIPILTLVNGDVGISRNPALTSVSLPALASVAGDFVVSANGVLTGLSLPELRNVGRAMTVTTNATLRQCLVDQLRNQLTSGPQTYISSGNTGSPNICP